MLITNWPSRILRKITYAILCKITLKSQNISFENLKCSQTTLISNMLLHLLYGIIQTAKQVSWDIAQHWVIDLSCLAMAMDLANVCVSVSYIWMNIRV